MTRVSADVTTDQRTGQSYYTIRVLLPPDEIARLGSDNKLVLGMPVEAFVQTGDRTMMSHLDEAAPRPADARVPEAVNSPRARRNVQHRPAIVISNDRCPTFISH
jgi:hypothetical protein